MLSSSPLTFSQTKTTLPDHLKPAHVRHQRLRHVHLAVLALVVLQHQPPACGQPQGQTRSAYARTPACPPSPRRQPRGGISHPSGAPGNRRSSSMTRFRDMVFWEGNQTSRSYVLRAPKPMSPVQSSTVRYGRPRRSRMPSAHLVMRRVFGFGVLGLRDRDEFDLDELMLADHALDVAPATARFRTEARRRGGHAHGEPCRRRRSARGRCW